LETVLDLVSEPVRRRLDSISTYNLMRVYGLETTRGGLIISGRFCWLLITDRFLTFSRFERLFFIARASANSFSSGARPFLLHHWRNVRELDHGLVVDVSPFLFGRR